MSNGIRASQTFNLRSLMELHMNIWHHRCLYIPTPPLGLPAIKCSWASVASLSHGYHVFDSYNDGIMAGL